MTVSDHRARAEAALVAFDRAERRRALAGLARTAGGLGVAEDALQDAAIRALEVWSRDGVPPEPAAWLVLTARRRAVDLLRREAARVGKERSAVEYAAILEPGASTAQAVRDDELRLLFTCCHPALDPATQIALALKHLCGLDVPAVARAMLVSESTMTRRLTRARTKIRDARIPYRVPEAEELGERVDQVLAVVYLLFNEGYAAARGPHVRDDLVDEALRLARLVHALLPGRPGPPALLALMLLQAARRPARLDPRGEVVLLCDQDRTGWSGPMIAEGVALVAAGIRVSGPVPHRYLVQAAIAACHSTAPSWAETDWAAITAWYDVLVGIDPSPAARLARAVARAQLGDPAAVLAEVDAIDGLDRYPPWHAARADLLDRMGRKAEAAAALRAARDLPTSDATAQHLDGLLAELERA